MLKALEEESNIVSDNITLLEIISRVFLRSGLMSSSTSSSTQAYQILRVPAKACLCGIPARVEISRSHQNPGRIYYNCRYFPNGCRFYTWLIPNIAGEGNQPDASASIQLGDINQLEGRIAMVEKSTKEMKFYL